jgi:hypothetical protein
VTGSPFLAGNSVAVNSLGAIITILDTGYLMLDTIQTGYNNSNQETSIYSIFLAEGA